MIWILALSKISSLSSSLVRMKPSSMAKAFMASRRPRNSLASFFCVGPQQTCIAASSSGFVPLLTIKSLYPEFPGILFIHSSQHFLDIIKRINYRASACLFLRPPVNQTAAAIGSLVVCLLQDDLLKTFQSLEVIRRDRCTGGQPYVVKVKFRRFDGVWKSIRQLSIVRVVSRERFRITNFSGL